MPTIIVKLPRFTFCCGNKFKLSLANTTEFGFDLLVTRIGVGGSGGNDMGSGVSSSAQPPTGWGQQLIIGWKAGPAGCKFPSGPSPTPGPPPPPPPPASQCFYPAGGEPIEVVHMVRPRCDSVAPPPAMQRPCSCPSLLPSCLPQTIR